MGPLRLGPNQMMILWHGLYGGVFLPQKDINSPKLERNKHFLVGMLRRELRSCFVGSSVRNYLTGWFK